MNYGPFMNEEEQTLKERYNSLEPSDRRYRHVHSNYIYELIKSCGTADDTTHDNFKYNFKKKYSVKHKLYSFKHDVYENAIELFGKIETLDDNLKRKLASAIQIMADYHKNKNTKNELERFANQYHWAFKRSFGGTRKTRRKALRKTLRKK